MKTLVSDFMAALLMEKPDDPVEFARVHFERYADAASAEAAEKERQAEDAARAEAEAAADADAAAEAEVAAGAGEE